MCSIPAAAQAYSLNITVVPAGPTGFITAYPTGQPLPLAATLVWSGGSLTSDAAIVPGGTSGSIGSVANANSLAHSQWGNIARTRMNSRG
jgi:hypothetical protein